MNLALTVITMLFAEQQFQLEAMLDVIIKWLIRGLIFLVTCLTSPFTLFRALQLRERCPPVRNRLLLMSATQLGKQIRQQEVTSEEVVMAYITRCREVNPIVNAIVETRFQIAIQEAREADDLIRAGQKNLDEIARQTPLLGIPVTIKESIAVQGMSHVAGNKTLKHPTAIEDADVVRRVRAAGGIVLLVSNTPEMCMCWETFNKITGTTVNPYDTRRTSGGSSGGEAALLGSAASVISLSSDIGGSIRLPAMFCGVFGHKPSPGTVSTAGHMPDCNDKEWPNFFTIGLMVRYAEDLPLVLKTMCQTDPEVLNLDKQVSLNDIKFFFMEDDGGSELTNSIDSEIAAGLRRVVNYLKSRHVVKKVEIKEMKYSVEIAATILLQLQAETIYMKGTNPQDLLGDNAVLIYPTFTSAAHYPYQIYHKVSNVSYMMIFNSLGLPVTQCPIGLNRNGLPIGIQIVANPGCDNLTIRVAQELEKEFGGWQPPTASEKLTNGVLIH